MTENGENWWENSQDAMWLKSMNVLAEASLINLSGKTDEHKRY